MFLLVMHSIYLTSDSLRSPQYKPSLCTLGKCGVKYFSSQDFFMELLLPSMDSRGNARLVDGCGSQEKKSQLEPQG